VLRDVLSAETANKPALLLVDMSELIFIDSVALHLIARAYRQLRADGCRLEIVRPNVAVARLLQLSALDQVIPVRLAGEAKDSPVPELDRARRRYCADQR
jgi:anti-anti-sigma factor